MISLFLLETDTQPEHMAPQQTQCQTALLSKGGEGRENGVNGSKMLLTLLPTRAGITLSPSLLFTGWLRYCLKFRMTQNGLPQSGAIPSKGGKMRRRQEAASQI